MGNVVKPAILFVGAHPGNYTRGRQGYAPEAVVIHTMGGYLGGCDAWFNDARAGVSTHFGVGRAGEIHQYVSESDTAHGNGLVEQGATARLITANGGRNPNLWTVSIEHDDQAAGALPSAEQFDASVRLTAWLFAHVLIPGGASGVRVDRDHILRHTDISPRSRAHCPGWPEALFGDYIARVRALVEGGVTYEQGVGVAMDMDAARDAAERAKAATATLDEPAVRTALGDLRAALTTAEGRLG